MNSKGTIVPEHRHVEVPLLEADQLADLYGIRSDLQIALELSERAIRLAEPYPPDFVVIDGIMWAAVIRYARCFMKGIRPALRAHLIDRLGPADKALHQYYLQLRSKYVAHSINGYDAAHVIAELVISDADVEVSGLRAGRHSKALAVKEALDLSTLIPAVIAALREDIEAEEARLLPLVRRQDPNILRTWHRRPPDVHRPEKVAKDRRQPRSRPVPRAPGI